MVCGWRAGTLTMAKSWQTDHTLVYSFYICEPISFSYYNNLLFFSFRGNPALTVCRQHISDHPVNQTDDEGRQQTVHQNGTGDNEHFGADAEYITFTFEFHGRRYN